MEPDSPILANTAPSITTPSFTEGRKEGTSLPEAEIDISSSEVLNDTSITLGSSIPDGLTKAYNSSFVALEKPGILDKTSQKELLANAGIINNISKQMIQEAEENSQVTLASQVLAMNQIFLDHLQKHYNLYLAPGAIHEEQTNQNDPTINSTLREDKLDARGIQNAFTTVQKIATKALVLN